MSEGFSAFKAMLVGVGILFAGSAIAPQVASGQFDLLRIAKSSLSSTADTFLSKGKQTSVLPGRGKGKGSTTGGTTTGGTTTGSTSGSTGSTGSTSNGFYVEDSMVPSNFDVNSELVPSWGTGAVAPSASPDVVGAFRFICNAGQLLYDDPIVYPGQPGKSHLHQFYGNTSANANSTYQSLRSTGQSTCMSPLNRSAYWMPAMLDGKGNVVRPDYVTIYYKRRPNTDPVVSDPNASGYEGRAVPLPNGLRFIFGYDMVTGKAPTGGTYFNCIEGDGSTQGHYASIPAAIPYCREGGRIGALISAPSCWDGKNLDSANHRDHVAYKSYGWWGYPKCPDTHPYVLPDFLMGAWYKIAPGDDLTKWKLSSDDMHPDLPHGSTFHADWFGAWDNTTMSMWMDNCINKKLNCSGGDLGNGKQMKMFSGFSWTASPRLVPIPG